MDGKIVWIGATDARIEGTFEWVTGEPWGAFLNWHPGEPNGAGGGGDSDYVQLTVFGTWNDGGNDEHQAYYLLEKENCIPHRTTATAVVVNGFVVDATIADSGCGYTNAPLVLIQGGGGSGATATAVITNGVVWKIIIS